jgi:Protein of unknown function (DUF3443)
MKSNKSVVVTSLLILGTLTASCGSSNSSAPAGPTCTTAAGPVAIPTSLNGTLSSTIPVYISDSTTTGPLSGFEQPLVSVTLCTPGHTSASQCQTISNILLDTGSYGLRVFASTINSNVQLAQQTVNVQGQAFPLAEIAEFGTGSDWGSVQNADVLLGNQTATNTPIQVIDINFAQIPSELAAQGPDTDPCSAGFNGILGVGLFAQDCGTECVSTNTQTNPGIYFACDSNGCYNASTNTTMIPIPLNQQVVNPIANFASGFNNGLSITLPNIGSSGAAAVSGSATFGIGSPTGVSLLLADASGLSDGNEADFRTTFGAITYGGAGNTQLAFIDSGSNGLFFPSTTIGTCPVNTDFYCGTGSPLSAVMLGYSSDATPSDPTVSFTIGDADLLFQSPTSTAFNNVGGPSSLGFDWGLPFFFGRTVYVGLNGTTATVNGSTTGGGPYWAF